MTKKWWQNYVRGYTDDHLTNVLEAILEVFEQLSDDWKTWIYQIHLKEKERRASR